MFVWWLWCLCAWPSCPPAAPTALADAGGALEEAYDALDVEAFDEHARRLRLLLRCWEHPLSREEAVAIHRWWGLVAITRDELSTMRGAWAAARQLDPTWTLDTRRWPVGHPVYQAFAEAGAVAADRVALAPNRWRVDGEDDTTVPRDRSFVLQQLSDGAVVYTGYHDSVASVPRDRNVPSGLRGHTSSVWFAVGAGAAWREQEVSGTATPFGAYTEGGVALSGRVGASILWAPRIGCDVDGVVVSALNTEGSTRVWPTARAQAHLWGRAGLDALEVVGSLGVGYARTTVSGWGRERAAFAVDLPLLLPGLEVRRVWERWRTSVRLEGLLASAWRPSGAHGRVLVGARVSERASVRLDGLVRVHHVEAFALNANGRAQGLDTYAAATVGGEWSW